jgi:hypothetical protein
MQAKATQKQISFQHQQSLTFCFWFRTHLSTKLVKEKEMNIKVKDEPRKSDHHRVQSYPMLATPTESKHCKYHNYYSITKKGT